MKCDSCGLESEFEEAFLKRRQLLGLIRRHFCPTCASRRELHTLLFLLSFGLLTPVVMKVAHPSLPLTWESLLWPLVALLAYPPFVVVHELAHALVARLFGMRVYTITIGIGKTLASGRFLGMRWKLRHLPLGGMTEVAGPPGRFDRLKAWLTYLAGPGVHAIVVLATMGLRQLLNIGTAESGLLSVALSLIYETNLVLMLFNLLPFRSSSPTGPTGTDGWNLLKLPFAKPDEVEERRAAYYVMEALEALRQRDPSSARQWIDEALRRHPTSPSAQIGMGYLLTKLRDFDGARQVFASTLAANRMLKPAMRYGLLNNIAYAHAVLRDADRLDEADRYSAEAYRNAPWVPAFVGTRGTVLVARGQVEEGIALLRRAMESSDEESGKAEDACLLAMAEMSRGNLASARHYLDLARRWDPQGVLMQAASQKLDEASQPQSSPAEGAGESPRLAPRATSRAGFASRIARLLPAGAPLTRQSMADWGWAIFAWGFWNLLFWRWFSIGPGLAFMAMGVVGIYSNVSGMLLGLSIVGAWTALTMLAWGTWPEMGFGLANLALAAILFFRYHRQGNKGNLPDSVPHVESRRTPSSAAGRRLALGAGVAGLVSLGWLVALAASVAAVIWRNPSAGPAALFDQFYNWGESHPYLFYLVNLLAVLGVALGAGALPSGARSRAPAALGMISGGGVLLLMLLAIAAA
jgi:Tfp pilus assembly protein PilF/Zn-dependent protease